MWPEHGGGGGGGGGGGKGGYRRIFLKYQEYSNMSNYVHTITYLLGAQLDDVLTVDEHSAMHVAHKN